MWKLFFERALTPCGVVPCLFSVHESSIVFNNIDNFKAFVGSDLHDELTGPTGLLEKLGGKDSVYLGARVYDEFGSA